jgi:hypothetical protein
VAMICDGSDQFGGPGVDSRTIIHWALGRQCKSIFDCVHTVEYWAKMLLSSWEMKQTFRMGIGNVVSTLIKCGGIRFPHLVNVGEWVFHTW